MQNRRDNNKKEQQVYEEWRYSLLANPEFRAVYEEEAPKKDLWLYLVEARQSAMLTQAELAKQLGVSKAQVARIEKRGYDAYPLTTLRRYVQAFDQDKSPLNLKDDSWVDMPPRSTRKAVMRARYTGRGKPLTFLDPLPED